MILLDANILIYSHVASFPEHAAMKAWLDGALSGSSRVGMPWPSLLAFIRLVTNPRVFERPESIPDAWRQVSDWLSAPMAWIPSPTERHAATMETLLPSCAKSNLIHDAHLAAIAMEHGLTLCSTDGDFARFPGLSWKNPLA